MFSIITAFCSSDYSPKQAYSLQTHVTGMPIKDECGMALVARESMLQSTGLCWGVGNCLTYICASQGLYRQLPALASEATRIPGLSKRHLFFTVGLHIQANTSFLIVNGSKMS